MAQPLVDSRQSSVYNGRPSSRLEPVISSPLVLSDPRDPGAPARNFIERWFAARLRQERDLKFVRVAGLISLLALPVAVSFYLWDFPGWVAPLYLVPLYALSAGRYTLMLHATCHRALFKNQHRLLNAWIPWLIGPLYGHTPTSFYVHHMGMHHPENNLENDLSSTMAYRRDSFAHFLHYWARFFFAGTYNLYRYMALRGRSKLLQRFIVGELSWYLVVGALLVLNWQATLVVFVIPWLLIRWFMMCGNFGQHAFVDVEDPGNCWTNSTCLVNVPYNIKCYNDGYHIVHHFKPAMHWSEMPAWLEENLEEAGANDAIIFDGLGNNQTVWFCLMTGNYGKLADHLVDLPGAPMRNRDEKISFLKQRVQRRAGDIKGIATREQALPQAAK